MTIESRQYPLAGIAFLAFLAVGLVLVSHVEHTRTLEKKRLALNVAVDHAHSLQLQIDQALSATYALAALVRQGGGGVRNFETVGKEMLPLYPGISSLQLAPRGIVSQIVPKAGNEAALGHDLLNDPKRGPEALAAVESKKLTLAGPFELLQGGIGMVGRLPVFLQGDGGQEQFWGFTIAVLRLEDVFRAANVHEMASENFDYELSRLHPGTGQRTVFTRSAPSELADPITYEISVPNGKWTLSIAPASGWYSYPSLAVEAAMVLLGSLLAAFVVYNIVRQPLMLRRQVQSRTRELEAVNQKLETEINQRRQAERALEKAYGEMELRVRERTAELSQASASLSQEIAERTQAEEALRRSNEELRQLSSHLESVREAERARIAREIHDELGSTLTALKMDLSWCVNNSERARYCPVDRVTEAMTLVDSALHTVRKIATDLRPSILDHLGLWAAIEWQVQELQERSGLRCKASLPAENGANLDAERSTALFRIVQEALTNVVRHADATEVNVDAHAGPDDITIEIRDNGKGVSEARLQDAKSWGILGMSERIRFFGGELRITGMPGRGTTVNVRMPAPAADYSIQARDKLC